MSFTQDELQAFNTILDQKLAIHRHELEFSLDQRMNVLRSEFKQYLISIEQDLLHTLSSQLSDQRNALSEVLNQNPGMPQMHMLDEMYQREGAMVEVEADISAEDLMNVMGKVMSDRLSVLEESIQAMVKSIESSLLAQLCSSRNDLQQPKLNGTPPFGD